VNAAAELKPAVAAVVVVVVVDPLQSPLVVMSQSSGSQNFSLVAHSEPTNVVFLKLTILVLTG